jgi:hypothetical protein
MWLISCSTLTRNAIFLPPIHVFFDDVAVCNILLSRSGLRKTISSQVSSVLTLKPDASYETCVEVAQSHPEADLRGGSGVSKPRMQVMQSNNRRPRRNNRDPRKNNRDPTKHCACHNCDGHTIDECHAVRRLKAAGKWRNSQNK